MARIQWTDINTWMPKVEEVVVRHLGPEGVLRMREAECSEYYADDPDWERLVERCTGVSEGALRAPVADVLSKNKFAAFHGCRPLDVATYIQSGLRQHDAVALIKEASQILNNSPKHVHLLEAATRVGDDLIRKWHGIDDGKTFLGIDERSLTDECGHYVIYGSEFIYCILVRVGAERLLLQRGWPTIVSFEADGAVEPREALIGLASIFIREWARQTVLGPQKVIGLDYSFIVHGPVSADKYIGHVHPASARDPLKNGVMRDLT